MNTQSFMKLFVNMADYDRDAHYRVSTPYLAT